MNIGLVAMSAKPYHAGHDQLIRLAAEENEKVMLYVSLSDRARKGELTIFGSSMDKIWKKFIEPSLPANVEVTYGGSPIRNIYQILGNESNIESQNIYTIYSDPVDLESSFPNSSLLKYSSYLFQNNQIIKKPIDRNETINISGTMMRSFLESGDFENFSNFLPPSIKHHSSEIINILLNKVNESLLRLYIRELIR